MIHMKQNVYIYMYETNSNNNRAAESEDYM